MKIEHEGMSFSTHQDKDTFLENRELRRKSNKFEFDEINERNYWQASVSDVGVWASPGGGPLGHARLFPFNHQNFWQEIKTSRIFKEAYPGFEWDTTKPRRPRPVRDEAEEKIIIDGLLVKLSRQKSKAWTA